MDSNSRSVTHELRIGAGRSIVTNTADKLLMDTRPVVAAVAQKRVSAAEGRQLLIMLYFACALRRSAQYFFIRADIAFRWAADRVERRPPGEADTVCESVVGRLAAARVRSISGKA